VEEAVTLLSGDPGARPLAGGTDLLVHHRLRHDAASLFVDLKRIPELGGIALDAAGLRLGAAVSAAELCASAEVAGLWPGLVDAVSLIGSAQIQGRASVGGNLCNASPAADTTCSLLVSGARALVAGPAGERTVDVEAFCTGPGKTALGPGEVLVALEIPRPEARTADAYLRLTPRTEMDIAVAGAAVRVTLDEAGVCSAARVAIGAVGPRAVLVPEAAEALVGSKLEPEALERAGAAASAAASPIDDKRGTASYRRTVVGVLTRRAAAIAGARVNDPDRREG